MGRVSSTARASPFARLCPGLPPNPFRGPYLSGYLCALMAPVAMMTRNRSVMSPVMLYNILMATAELFPPCWPALLLWSVSVKLPEICARAVPSDILAMTKVWEAACSSDMVKMALKLRFWPVSPQHIPCWLYKRIAAGCGLLLIRAFRIALGSRNEVFVWSQDKYGITSEPLILA